LGLRRLLATQKDWQICGEAVTGLEAVDQARQLQPDIVILDFSMPGLNGVEATRQIRQVSPQTEVLILTMHDSETLAQEVLAAGARAFLVKTDTARHLVPAIEALARHEPFFTSTVSALVLNGFLHPRSHAAKGGASCGRLTPRECEVIQLLAKGKTNKKIAVALAVSVRTVDAHRANMMRKFDFHSVSQLVLYAVRNQIIQP